MSAVLLFYCLFVCFLSEVASLQFASKEADFLVIFKVALKLAALKKDRKIGLVFCI